jgi:hypothetical protein
MKQAVSRRRNPGGSFNISSCISSFATSIRRAGKSVGAAWNFAQSIEGGPGRVIVVGRWGVRKVGERLLDAYFSLRGLDTKGPDFDHDFDGTSDSVGYVPTPWRLLPRLFPI